MVKSAFRNHPPSCSSGLEGNLGWNAYGKGPVLPSQLTAMGGGRTR